MSVVGIEHHRKDINSWARRKQHGKYINNHQHMGRIQNLDRPTIKRSCRTWLVSKDEVRQNRCTVGKVSEPGWRPALVEQIQQKQLPNAWLTPRRGSAVGIGLLKWGLPAHACTACAVPLTQSSSMGLSLPPKSNRITTA